MNVYIVFDEELNPDEAEKNILGVFFLEKDAENCAKENRYGTRSTFHRAYVKEFKVIE